ncbi:putative ribonuclease h protein [Quercus suber]|uniref:Ribonuclease h protein n=1 Tax=Quercus suber TaxID=58331 RepID=A0AAW0JF54_QUESU
MNRCKDAGWAKVLHKKYQCRRQTKSSRQSRVWAAVEKGKVICDQGAKWTIGSHSSLRFWHDKWLNIGTLRSLVEGPLTSGEDNLMIKDVTANGSWDLHLLSVPLSPFILNAIQATTLRRVSVKEDQLSWISSTNVAQEFWRVAGCPPQVQASFSGGLVDWLQVNAHSPLRAVHKDYPWKCFFLFGVWNLWLQRNRKAFKQQEASLNLLQAVEMQVREFFYCVANQDEIRNKEILHVRWSKPGDGWLKLNTDGSFGGEGVNSGCGGLIRDSNGLWIRGFAKTVVVNSSLASEMWALREGLTLCLDLQPQAMEIKLDATAAISFLSGNSNTNGDLSGLVDDCRDLLLQLPQVRMLHCYREANSCADALARLGAAGDGGDSYFVTPPHSVIPLLNFDFMGKHRSRLGSPVCETSVVY